MQGILVTGMPRTGTSWLGKMLEAEGEVVYINEPLNPRHPAGTLVRAPVKHRFQYINAANEHLYLEPFRETLRLEYRLRERLRTVRSAATLLRIARHWSAVTQGRLRGRRALVNDPFAVFSAEWFARRLGCWVVVIVRHPAAVIASRRQLGWRTDFRHLLGQPLLLNDWLAPFQGDMEAALAADDELAEGALLWRMIYHVVAVCQQRNRQLVVVRHEDLSIDPISAFATLFADLGLRFTKPASTTIERATTGGAGERGFTWSLSRTGPSRTSFRPLDSRANSVKWKARLTPDEVARIRSLTSDVAPLYYSDDDWDTNGYGHPPITADADSRAT